MVFEEQQPWWQHSWKVFTTHTLRLSRNSTIFTHISLKLQIHLFFTKYLKYLWGQVYKLSSVAKEYKALLGLGATASINLSKSTWKHTLQDTPVAGFSLQDLILLEKMTYWPVYWWCVILKGNYSASLEIPTCISILLFKRPHLMQWESEENEPYLSEFVIPKQNRDKWIQLGKHKETMSFCFFSFNSISTSKLNNEIVK